MRRLVFYSLLLLLLSLVSLLMGIRLTEFLMVTHDAPIAPGRLFSAETPMPIPSLQTIVGAAQTDAEALDAVTGYFDANQVLLAVQFAEHNPTRLRAFYAMYTAHVSHLYGTHEPDTNFLDWLADPVADCDSYALNQGRTLTALGVHWRQIAISGGTHTFIEADIDGRWETFDATVNEWMDRGAFEMERGAIRSYRAFWSPMDDAAYTKRYQPGMQASVQDLRISMRGLGLYWWPRAYLFVVES